MFSALWGLIKELAIGKKKKKKLLNFWKFKRKEFVWFSLISLINGTSMNILEKLLQIRPFLLCQLDCQIFERSKKWTNLLEIWEFEVPDPHLESSILINSWDSAHKIKKCNMFDVLCTGRLDKTICNQQAFLKTDYKLEV